MAWILLVVALALVTGYLIVTFGYRTSIIALLVTLALGLVLVVWYAEFHEGTRPDLISVEEVELDNFSVELAYGNSYKLYARVLNRSAEYGLTAVGLDLNAADCTGSGSAENCVIVGQQRQEIRVSVPAKQARDITHQLNFPPMRPQGTLKWTFDVRYVEAHK